jgi:histidine ammonia-lyase
MIAQYTAASLVSENKIFAHPASVDSIPTSANKEDHVSMSASAACKCRETVKNAQIVIAIELLCGAQALDLFTNLKPGAGTLAAYRVIRDAVPHLDNDRILSCPGFCGVGKHNPKMAINLVTCIRWSNLSCAYG